MGWICAAPSCVRGISGRIENSFAAFEHFLGA